MEYMKLFVGKIVDSKIRGVVSSLTRWKVVMIIPILFIILRLGHILIRKRPIQHIWLV